MDCRGPGSLLPYGYLFDPAPFIESTILAPLQCVALFHDLLVHFYTFWKSTLNLYISLERIENYIEFSNL